MTKIGVSAFRQCIKLIQITVPKGVTEIGRCAFCGCKGLTQINILEDVTEIGEQAFSFCCNLTQMTIPESVTEIDWYAFHYCYKLTQVTISESVPKIGRYAFKNCKNLKKINIPEGVTDIDKNAFQDCHNLQRISVSSNNRAARVKACLPDKLKDKVTSYYLQHQQNFILIRQIQIALCSRSFSVSRSSLNNDVTGLTYLYLSFQDIITLSGICKSLNPLKVIAQSIQAVNYRGAIPAIKPTPAVKTSFLQQYHPSEDDNELTPYQRSLNDYKLILKKSITQPRHESKSNNINRIMQCHIL